MYNGCVCANGLARETTLLEQYLGVSKMFTGIPVTRSFPFGCFLELRDNKSCCSQEMLFILMVVIGYIPFFQVGGKGVRGQIRARQKKHC